MANIRSARKRARQAPKRRERNMSLRTVARSAVKDVKKAIAAGDKKAAVAALVKSQAAIDRVHAPLGLSIGSQTVPEIAVSIVAELIACRNLGQTIAAARIQVPVGSNAQCSSP